MAGVEQRSTQIQTTLLFFDLEWAALDDARADELLAADGLDFCRHHLRMERRYRPHLLSEPEEKVMTEKALTGSSAWGRLFAELTSSTTVDAAGGRRARGARRRAQPARLPRPRRAPRGGRPR